MFPPELPPGLPPVDSLAKHATTFPNSFAENDAGFPLPKLLLQLESEDHFTNIYPFDELAATVAEQALPDEHL